MTEKQLAELREQLKVIFKGYKRMNASMEKRLRNLGFFVVRSKKHIILSYTLCNKELRIEMACTPSDSRSGIKKVSDIIYVIRSSGLVY